LKAFCFQAPRWSLNQNRSTFFGTNIERSAVQKIFLALTAAWLGTSAAQATFLREKFNADPALDGWQVFGDADLFAWNPTNHALDVTWDSSQTNSYFYHPLGATFAKADSFCVLFDLNLTDANASGYFQLAIGLCNFAEATSTNFSRANGVSPDLLEFDYFPDGPFSSGPSVDATLVDSEDRFYFAFDTNSLPDSITMRVVLIHRGGASAVTCEIFTNGQPFRALNSVYDGGPGGFQLDTLAICNYTTTDDIYGDSLLAHGSVGNLTFASPLPVDKIKTFAEGQIQFASDTNWLYTLEQSSDFQTWSAVAPPQLGNGTNLLLQATNLPANKSFYRVRAELP
jgi:hypothetical protein